jgi:hypothetical protein
MRLRLLVAVVTAVLEVFPMASSALADAAPACAALPPH